MYKLFVPYNIAIKLKEKGFNEECLEWYHDSRETSLTSDNIFLQYKEEPDFCFAPIYQQVIDWFEEKHKILIESQREPFGKWTASIVNDYTITHEGLGNITFYSKNIYVNNDYKGFNNKYDSLDKSIEEALKLI